MEAQINKKPKVYIIAGKARNGKNSVANEISEIYKEHGKTALDLSFADTIKHYAVKYFGWDGSDVTKPRKLLQELGTDIIRQKLNKPDFHVSRTCQDIEVLNEFFDAFTISDCRFPNEIEYIQNNTDFNITTIYVKRVNFISPLTVEQQHHISETALDKYNNFDYCIVAGTIDELKQKVRDIIKL